MRLVDRLDRNRPAKDFMEAAELGVQVLQIAVRTWTRLADRSRLNAILPGPLPCKVCHGFPSHNLPVQCQLSCFIYPYLVWMYSLVMFITLMLWE